VTALARVCLTCRAALDDGGACDGGDRHEVLALDDPAQRARLIEAVWGDALERRRTHQRIRAEAVRGQKIVLTSGALGFAAAVALGEAAAFFFALGGAALGGIASHLTRPREGTTYPRGGEPRAWGRVSARGRVRGSGEVWSPASGESCAAWTIELRYDGSWGERVMLRAGETAGLEIALDGGEVLRVPAGPIALVEPPQQVDELSSARITALLRGLDPLGSPGEPFTPLPYNVVAEALLFVGDRVEVLGEMDRVIAPSAGGGALYRDAPRSQLAPHGVAVLRRC
jgi:hypothetical protein